jgi:hypothetical protein
MGAVNDQHPHEDEINGQVAQFRELLGSADLVEVAAAMAGYLESAPSRRRPPRTDVVTYRIRLALDEVEPEVWRLLEVPSDMRLAALHPVVQEAMGWTDSHLHQFAAGDGPDDPRPERYLTAFDLAEGDVGVPETDVRLDELLQDPGDRLEYAYDFGDGWHHSLTLAEVLPRDTGAPAVRCLDGAGGCPPEDCGGPGGYADLLDTARRLAAGGGVDVEEAEMLTLTFPGRSPEEVVALAGAFDVKAADDAVGRAGGRRSGQERRSGHERRSGARRPGGERPTRRAGEARTPSPAHGSRGEMGDLARALVNRADGPYAGVVVEMVEAARLDEPTVVAPDVAERMVAPFAWMISYLGAQGVDLTSAGYLHAEDVEAVAGALDVGPEGIGALSREGQTLPVLAFRQACQSARLLRLTRGRLSATRIATQLADDPVALWWHLADRLPLGRTDVERDAGAVLLLDVACHGEQAGPWPPPHLRFDAFDQIDDHLAAALHALGWAGSGGVSLQSWQVRSLAGLTVTVLERLGAYEPDPDHHTGHPTPEGVAFARAALRGRGGS